MHDFQSLWLKAFAKRYVLYIFFECIVVRSFEVTTIISLQLKMTKSESTQHTVSACICFVAFVQGFAFITAQYREQTYPNQQLPAKSYRSNMLLANPIYLLQIRTKESSPSTSYSRVCVFLSFCLAVWGSKLILYYSARTFQTVLLSAMTM